MVTIRLAPIGKKGENLYKISVATHRAKLTGRYLEKIGIYRGKNEETFLDQERYDFWIKKGAQPTPRVLKIIANAKPMPKFDPTQVPAPRVRVQRPVAPMMAKPRPAAPSRSDSSNRGGGGSGRPGAGRPGSRPAPKKS
jgi:small subunit ribosomal protein S16